MSSQWRPSFFASRRRLGGFGLLEMIMAISIAASGMYFLSVGIRNLSIAQKRTEEAGDFASLFASVSQILSRTESCRDALRSVGGKNIFDQAINVPRPMVIFRSSPDDDPELDPDPNPLLNKTPFRSLFLETLTLTKTRATGANAWVGRIDMEVKRAGTKNVPLKKQFFINLGTNAAGEILTCEAGIESTTIQAAACGGWDANYDQNPPAGANSCSFRSGSAAAPSIKFSFGAAAPFTHDTNTGLFSPSADSVGISAGGRETLLIANTSAASANFRGRVITNYTSNSAAGNARGSGSVDLQFYRENADEVASGMFATLTGGYKNKGIGPYSFVGGGSYQYAIGDNSVAVGGWSNTAEGNRAAILGGYGNRINSGFIFNDAAIVGGWRNTISGGYSFMGAGGRNIITGRFSAIVAGGDNDTGWGNGPNEIRTDNSFIGAGGTNLIEAGENAAIVSGYRNRIATNGTYSFIGGGWENRITSNAGGVVAGEGLLVDGYAQTAVGRFNTIPGSAGPTSRVDSDLLFIVGNGYRVAWPDPPVRRNAFTVDGLGNIVASGNANITGDLSASNANFTNAVTANTVTAVTVTETSDRRLKKDISPLKSILQKIMALKPVSFFWRDDEKNNVDRRIGFIAQEVEEEFPELVRTDSDGIKSVQYGAMVAPLTKAIQEQQLIIEDQQREIAQQKNELEEMKKIICSIRGDANICRK